MLWLGQVLESGVNAYASVKKSICENARTVGLKQGVNQAGAAAVDPKVHHRTATNCGWRFQMIK
jgi:hypothetical protein